MRRLPATLGFLAVLALASSTGGATAASGDLAAFELVCPPAGGPGRVVCVLRVTALEGRVAWADAVARSAPALARPLRARVAASPSGRGSGGEREVPIALVATREGRGELVVDGRAVLCVPSDASGERCVPVVSRRSAAVVVGATER